MIQLRTTPIVARTIVNTVLLAGMALLTACSSAQMTGSRLAIADFSDQSLQSDMSLSESEAKDALESAGLRPAEPIYYPTPMDDSMETFFDVEIAPGESVIVDSLIGQVNGRPIYADEVLGPIADQLNAEYASLPWKEFQGVLVRLVQSQLQELILNELYLSEARAGLSADEQTGLMAFMQNLREELVGERGGGRGEAERQIMQEEGLTWDEYLQLQEDQLLIRSLMQEKIQPNVMMSWKDVERLYNARKAQYQPDPSVMLGRIHIRTEGNEDKIKTVQAMLDAGDTFETVATWAGASDGGVWDTFKMGKGGVTDIEVADFYKEHLKGLGPGETSKSFVRNAYTIWVSVIEVTRPQHYDLYDPEVQSALQSEILGKRMMRARQQYIEGLLKKGIYDNIEDMQMRVIGIAFSRYPEGR